MSSYTNQVNLKGFSKSNTWNWFLLFLIWPFGALLKSTSWFRTKDAMNLFWMFCVYFGFTFVFSEGSYADSSGIALYFQKMSTSGMGLSELMDTFYTAGSSDIDIVQKLIIFIVSRFTGDSRILFAFFGLVFGYFYSRNIWLIVNKTNSRIGLYSGLVLICFIFVNGIWNINAFRFHTAAQVYIYGILYYLLNGNRSKLLFAFASVFVHWSFSIVIIILILYLFLRNKTSVFFAFFVFSFFMASLKLDIINRLFESYAPQIVVESRSSYFDETNVQSLIQSRVGTSWYLLFYNDIMKWIIFANYILIYLRRNSIEINNSQFLKLFNYSLLFYAIINLISGVPSVHRFYEVANMLSLALIFQYFQMTPSYHGIWLKRIAIPFFLLFIIISLRFAFDYVGVMLFLGSPLFAWLAENQVPMIDFIKQLL